MLRLPCRPRPRLASFPAWCSTSGAWRPEWARCAVGVALIVPLGRRSGQLSGTEIDVLAGRCAKTLVPRNIQHLGRGTLFSVLVEVAFSRLPGAALNISARYCALSVPVEVVFGRLP